MTKVSYTAFIKTCVLLFIDVRDEYLQALKLLTRDCNFQNLSGNQVRDQYICDAFINGLHSSSVRQGLLENITLDLKIFDQGQRSSSESYSLKELAKNSTSDQQRISSQSTTETIDSRIW
ncbi:hypothetical protein GJ496_001055 [Pomphorhynchus laevis]|nr:hypothetical protein GJ496_001055 [Pomphorhynchus laevis]